MNNKTFHYPKGCKITNIRPGKGNKKDLIYAKLKGPNGELLISATLEYITNRLLTYGVEDNSNESLSISKIRE